MEKKIFRTLAAVCVVFFTSCTTVTALDVGDCTFFVGPDDDLVLSYEVVLACAGLIVVNIV
jgi:hypothetical protein